MIYKLVTRQGADFDSLAKIYSTAETANRGGYVGFITHGESDKPYEKQAFKTKEGSVSRPVSTDEGYWLVKVDSRDKAKQKTLEKVSAPIRSKVYRQKREAAETALKERLFAEADVTYFSTEEFKTPEEENSGSMVPESGEN
jgi:parvulin-like peptidyl-prolyl isomerase